MVGGVIGAVAGTKLSSKFGLQGKCKLPNPSKVLNAARSGLSKVKSGASKIISKTKQVISKGKKYKSTIKKVMKRVATEGAKGGAKGAAEGYVQSKMADQDAKQGVISGGISGMLTGGISSVVPLKGITKYAFNGTVNATVGGLMSEKEQRIGNAVIGGAQGLWSAATSDLTFGLEITGLAAKGMLNLAMEAPDFTLGFVSTLISR